MSFKIEILPNFEFFFGGGGGGGGSNLLTNCSENISSSFAFQLKSKQKGKTSYFWQEINLKISKPLSKGKINQ